ncbi:hypothetical protein [uncultured Roseovarius sp.]|uniref:hypothetical protein n=1 Tax=uncultured Roseovarius sp. TaxID=293344 RepID=UPI00260DCC4A|nr:hypothetical protein [uncultured Roseovarius sp.]
MLKNLLLAGAASLLIAGTVAAEPPTNLGRYTYEGHGSVNTHWIETPEGLVVIDVQREACARFAPFSNCALSRPRLTRSAPITEDAMSVQLRSGGRTRQGRCALAQASGTLWAISGDLPGCDFSQSACKRLCYVLGVGLDEAPQGSANLHCGSFGGQVMFVHRCFSTFVK